MQPELRQQTEGRWPAIYSHFGFDERFLSQKHMPCPLCGGKDRFRFCYANTGTVVCNQCIEESCDGIEFLMRYTGQDFKSLAEEIRGVISTAQMPRTDNTQDIERAKKALTRVWSESVMLSKGDPVCMYLTGRKLVMPTSPDIRLHKSMPYYDEDGKMLGKYPCMIALVRTAEGDKATIHRTYLDDNGGKADVPKPKKVMPPAKSWQGGFIRVKDGGLNSLVIAEGIETTLAYIQLSNSQSGWAAIAANNLTKIRPPESAKVVHIAGDNDKSFTGQKVAYMLANRIRESHSVYVDIPDETDMDWADVVAETEAGS